MAGAACSCEGRAADAGNFAGLRTQLLDLMEQLTCAHELEIAALNGQISELRSLHGLSLPPSLPQRVGATCPGGPLLGSRRAVLPALQAQAVDIEIQNFEHVPSAGSSTAARAGSGHGGKLSASMETSELRAMADEANHTAGRGPPLGSHASASATVSTSQVIDDGCDSLNEEDALILSCCPRKRSKRHTGLTLRQFSLRDALVYKFEALMMTHGFYVQVVGLAVLGLLQIGLGGMTYSRVWRYEEGADPRDEKLVSPFFEGIWEAWTFMADPGTHAKVFFADQRLVAATIAVLGICYFAVILGVIVDGVQEKMEGVKQGKSSVVEKNHIVVLGWTDKVIPLLREICSAQQGTRGSVIVILADEPIETMLVELSLQLPTSERCGTKIVCRNGSPILVSDLLKVSAERARAIVLLSCGSDADNADSRTLRSVLSLNSLGWKLRGHVVAEVRDIDNEPLLRLVGGGNLETLVSHDMLGRLMVMSARQPGLAKVYESLLGYDGMEFYIRGFPELSGCKFSELLERFPTAVCVGVRQLDGSIVLNPDGDYIIDSSDDLIVIAEDSDSYAPAPPADIDAGERPACGDKEAKVEKILICGWRRDIRDVLQLLDSMVQRGSEVHLMTHFVPESERVDVLREEGLDVHALANIELIHHHGNTSARRHLEVLPLETFTSVMIFAEQAFELDAMHSDSHALSTLLLIRDIQSVRDAGCRSPIICEILDSRTRSVIARHSYVRRSSDFMQSNRIVAQMLAMTCQQRGVKCIFDELLGVAGCKLEIEQSASYVAEDEMVSFWQVAKRVATNDKILIGYTRKDKHKRSLNLNPERKDAKQAWDNLDLVVVTGGESPRALMRASIDAGMALMNGSSRGKQGFFSRLTGFQNRFLC